MEEAAEQSAGSTLLTRRTLARAATTAAGTAAFSGALTVGLPDEAAAMPERRRRRRSRPSSPTSDRWPTRSPW
jgi:hypothetical protein